MHKVSRSLLFASILALGGLAACGDDVTVAPPGGGSTTITIAPNPATVAVGGTVNLAASTSTSGVTITGWSSSNTAVATVTNAGVVTGVAAGQAAITATASNGATAVATVTVSAASTQQQASVSISSITKGGLQNPVALNNVQGQIDVTLNVDPGQQNVQAVVLYVIDSATGTRTEVARQAIVSASIASAEGLEGLNLAIAQANASAAAAIAQNVPQQITLSFNTAAFTIQGTPTAPTGATVLYPNGRKQIRAELVLGTGTSQDQVASNSVSVFFNNQDGFYAVQEALSSTDVTGGVTSTVAPWTGTIWYQTGNGIRVVTVPVMYSGRTIASRTVQFDFVNTADVSTTIAGAGAQTVTLAVGTRADSGRLEVINAVATDGNAVSLVSYDPDGAAGPATTEFGIINAQPRGTINNNENIGVRLDSLRTDNVAPMATYNLAAVDSNWVNGVYSFLRTGNFSGVSDVAVGLANATAPFGATFQYQGCGSTTFTAATSGADIPECATDLTNRAYTGRIILRDRLGNTLTTPTFTFAVDKTAPRIQYLLPAQDSQVVRMTDDSVFHPAAATYENVTSNNAEFGVRYTDERSGFNVVTGSLRASITRLYPVGTTATTTCVLGTGTNCSTPASIIGTVETTELGADPTFRRYTVPIYGTAAGQDGLDAGYYTFRATLTDRAGNEAVILGGSTPVTTAAPLMKQAAIDVFAPQITGVTVPAILTGGATNIAFTPTGTDDLEVLMGDLALLYPDLNDGSSNGYIRWNGRHFPLYDAPWNSTLATPVGPGATFGANGLTIPGNFITRVEVVDNDSTPQQANAPDIVTTVGARLRDIKTISDWATDAVDSLAYSAGTSSLLTAPIFPAQVVTAGTTFGSREGNTADATRVNQFYVMSTTNTTVTVRAVGPTISVNPPFTRIEILRLNTATGVYDVLRGTLSAVSTADQGNNRFYTWTFTLDQSCPTGLPVCNAVTTQQNFAAGQIIRALGVDATGNALATLRWTVGSPGSVLLNP